MNKKLLLAGVLCCAHAFAQNVSQFGGIYNALSYAYGVNGTGSLIVSVGNKQTGVSTIALNSGQVTLVSGSTVIMPLATNAPVNIGGGSSLETITPTAISCSTPTIPNTCRITANFTRVHGFGDRVASATVGLNEALNAAGAKGGSAIVDGAWVSAGGTQAMIDAAPTVANTVIIDNRTGFSGGGGAGNPGGTNGQIQFNNNGVFGGITATGTGNVVKATSPTLVTPALGTPSALVLTNATALPGGQITGANSVPASTLPLATTGAFGAVKPDGTTITISAGVISSTGSGGSVTWPTTGDLVLSNSTSSPAGLAPINGDCVIGSGSAWVAGSCSGSGGTTATALQNGLLSAIPTCATNGQIYQANDQPDGQQEYNCSNFGGTFHWVQKLNIDASGPIITGGTLGIDHTIIPCLACANVLPALNKLGALAGTGSAPAISNGTGTMAVNSGSTNVAGSLTSSTSGTVTFTLTWASLTYAHRAVCHFVDETTAADSVKTTQGTVPTTTTLTASGTTVSGDIVSYSCAGY